MDGKGRRLYRRGAAAGKPAGLAGNVPTPICGAWPASSRTRGAGINRLLRRRGSDARGCAPLGVSRAEPCNLYGALPQTPHKPLQYGVKLSADSRVAPRGTTFPWAPIPPPFSFFLEKENGRGRSKEKTLMGADLPPISVLRFYSSLALYCLQRPPRLAAYIGRGLRAWYPSSFVLGSPHRGPAGPL